MSESAKKMCLKTIRRMVLERDKRFSLVRHATGLALQEPCVVLTIRGPCVEECATRISGTRGDLFSGPAASGGLIRCT